MNHFRLTHRHVVLRLVILGLLAFAPSFATAQEQSASVPLLLDGSAASAPGSARVTGHNFTPGGAVYLALYDQWGMELHETHWVTASVTTFGPNGSQDPANGYVQGGTIDGMLGIIEPVYGPNGSQDPANGYVRGSDDTMVVGIIEPVFGPNGSQDPASGYIPGNPKDEVALILCGTALMVRAYDAQTEVWSNVLDIDPGC